MTKKEFLDIINDIDDEFLNEFANSGLSKKQKQPGDEFSADEFGGAEKPQIIKLTPPPRARTSLFMGRLTAAVAVICVIAVGAFAFIRLNKLQTASPNNSGEAYLSDISDSSSLSSLISDNSTSDPISESDSESDRTSGSSLAIPESSDRDKSSEDRLEYGSFEASFRDSGIRGDKIIFRSETVVKSNRNDFAQISIEYRGATERFPIYVQIYKNADRREWIVSETIKFTDGNADKLGINYTETVEPGDELVLEITASSGAYAKGTWLP